ncbi:MAG: hypothetical protein E7813_06135 [Bradyrhizobium sp.]|uniref:hypothetical protein n=1 Tax=Bradyrhizobium sp. TaxID=376 RepID=UPI001223DCE2|nr:hypothetical protein [Bradyrhizobium sp.]THD71143.1 MAG: hypothetical protein E7813_06135 [Bradyrhizobium sp.]
MDWKKERDLLIAQTLAFVQSVAGKKTDVEAVPDEMPAASPHVEAAAAEIREIFERPVVAPHNTFPVSAPVSGIAPASDFRTEIQARIESFRAHQERFDREREEYFSATLAKARAAIRNDTAPPPSRPVSR